MAATSGQSLLIRGLITVQPLPSTSLHLANLQFRSLYPVDDYRLSLNINELIDFTTAPVGNPEGIIAPIRILDAIFGDVNEDSKVNIVDALLVAQAYVDLTTLDVEEREADLNNDRKATIVDALLMAQYYVGFIDQFPVETYTPGPVPAIATL